MTANTSHQELSTFISNAVRKLSPASTFTIEHAIRAETGDTLIERAVVPPAALRALGDTLQTHPRPPARSETYLQAPAVARMLGIKTGTLAKWRRLDKGPKGWVRTSPTTVAYPLSEVNAFIADWQKG